MKQLVMFPGKMDGVFFRNEIPYIAEQFDKIIIFTYPGNRRNLQKIARSFNLEYYIVPNFSVYALIKAIWQMFTDPVVIKEKKKCRGKQFMYMMAYLLWENTVEKVFEKKSNMENIDTFLYSFWLSRGAYTICRFKEKYNNTIKTVSRAHGYDLYEERNPYRYLPFREYIASKIDEIYFISNDGRKYFENKYRNYNSKLCISRLGTQEENYRKEIKEKTTVCIASCSHIIEVKRVDLIIDALSELNCPFFWIHLGDGVLKGKMEKYANRKLAAGTYCFLGNVNNREIVHVYEKYDVDFLVNLSDSEGVPVSIMEAMSMGIPAIARDVGGNKEIVDTEHGLLLKRESYLGELQKIVKKRFHEEEYRELSVRAYQIWEEQYHDKDNYMRFAKNLSSLTREWTETKKENI